VKCYSSHITAPQLQYTNTKEIGKNPGLT